MTIAIKPGSKINQRHSIRLEGYDYSQAGGYYITMVTFGREWSFGEVVCGKMIENSLGLIARECWEKIPLHFPNVEIDSFVVMPNHVHGILFIHESNNNANNSMNTVGARHVSPLRKPTHSPRGFMPGSLGAIVASFKSSVTRRAGRELHSHKLWQRNYFEHVLRDQADYERVSAYILDNPLNWDQDENYPEN